MLMTELESRWMVRIDLSGTVNGLVLEPEEKLSVLQGRFPALREVLIDCTQSGN